MKYILSAFLVLPVSLYLGCEDSGVSTAPEGAHPYEASISSLSSSSSSSGSEVGPGRKRDVTDARVLVFALARLPEVTANKVTLRYNSVLNETARPPQEAFVEPLRGSPLSQYKGASWHEVLRLVGGDLSNDFISAFAQAFEVSQGEVGRVGYVTEAAGFGSRWTFTVDKQDFDGVSVELELVIDAARGISASPPQRNSAGEMTQVNITLRDFVISLDAWIAIDGHEWKISEPEVMQGNRVDLFYEMTDQTDWRKSLLLSVELRDFSMALPSAMVDGQGLSAQSLVRGLLNTGDRAVLLNESYQVD